MPAFSATLVLDPTLLRGLRHSLAAWLDHAGAPATERDSMVLATHEAAARAMTSGDSGSTVAVTAKHDGDGGFVVRVRNQENSDAHEPVAKSPGFALISELMSEVTILSTTSVCMRKQVPAAGSSGAEASAR